MNAIMARGDLAGSAAGGIDSKISSFAMTAGYALTQAKLYPSFKLIRASFGIKSTLKDACHTSVAVVSAPLLR